MLPFRDGAFDAVLGKQILHHLDLTIAVPEIARVLRPGGRAVFLEPLTPAPTAGVVSTTRSWRAIAASRRTCAAPPSGRSA